LVLDRTLRDIDGRPVTVGGRELNTIATYLKLDEDASSVSPAPRIIAC
jgi:hypothetical protein